MRKTYIKTDEQVVRVLKEMQTILRHKKNWTKGAFQRGSSAYCLLGARDEACVRLNYFDGDLRVTRRLERAIPKSRRVRSVWVFNDRLTTTHRHILALLKRAIAEKKNV